jgi:hypothetical protein
MYLSPCEEVTLVHLSTVDAFEPSHPIFSELLNLRPQLIALHIEIVNSTNPGNQLSRVPRTDPVHQCSTNGAEVVGHCVARGDSPALSIPSKLVLAADMRCSRLIDDKVGCECRRMDLMVVGAVADEGGDKIWALDRLKGVT